jgi:hypothetical protein
VRVVNCFTSTRITRLAMIKRELFLLEFSAKRRKINLLSLSFEPNLISEKNLIKKIYIYIYMCHKSSLPVDVVHISKR